MGQVEVVIRLGLVNEHLVLIVLNCDSGTIPPMDGVFALHALDRMIVATRTFVPGHSAELDCSVLTAFSGTFVWDSHDQFRFGISGYSLDSILSLGSVMVNSHANGLSFGMTMVPF